mgnify:FL=1
MELADSGNTVWIASIRGTINPASGSYFRSAIQKAEKDNAQALIIELDTPGGLLSSVRDMAQAVATAKVPVIVYVTPAGSSATSAGALLMLASHIAAMAPGTNIGAAHPVGPQGEEIKGAAGEKATSDTAAFARGLAEISGRNRYVAEEIVSKSKSFTAEEALKQSLIELVVSSRDELIAKLDGRQAKTTSGTVVIKTINASIKTAEMTLGQKLLHYLANPNIAAILMTLGILLIYVELSNPGITIAGILGGISLLVAFMSFQLLPIKVTGLILLVLGVVLLLAEPFVVSHGVFAVGGILAFILGLLWVVDPSETVLRISPAVLISATLSLGVLVAAIGIAASRMRMLTRKTLEKIGGSTAAGLSGYEAIVKNIESDGHSGKISVRGELWDFVSDIPVNVGDKVRIDSVSGFKAVVSKRQ